MKIDFYLFMFMYQEIKHRFSFFHFTQHIPSVFKSVQQRKNEPGASGLAASIRLFSAYSITLRSNDIL